MSEEIRREVSPLRQRMIEDMCMRKMQDRTQEAYIRGVRRLARFLGRSPEAATAEDLRRFQLQLVKAGVSPITLNATLTAVKFLFQVTLDRPEVVAKVRQVRVEQRLPVVLSREEVTRLTDLRQRLRAGVAALRCCAPCHASVESTCPSRETNMAISRMLYPLPIALACVGVQAQPLRVADGLAGVTEASAPQSSAPANHLAYRSALIDYRAYQDESVENWSEANERVRQIGGWQAYGSESREALRAPSPQSQRPASPPSPSAPGHDAHHGARK